MSREHIEIQRTSKTRNTISNALGVFFQHQGFSAFIPIIFVAICMFCGASWLMFWSNTDPARYQCYALTFWMGNSATALLPAQQCSFLHLTTVQAAFHMLPIEYPPLTLLLFSLPLLAPLPYYQLAFALLMALTSGLIYWLLMRYGPHSSALVFALYLLIGAVAIAAGRFDLVPAALTLLSVMAAERGRWRSAYIALAFGTLLKLYPIALLLVLFLAEQQVHGRIHFPPQKLNVKALPRHAGYMLRGIGQWRWSNCLLFFALVVGITGFFAILDFQGAVTSQVSYFIQRPIQVEATGSTFLWVARKLGVPLHIVYTFGSLNIQSQFNGIVALAGSMLLVLGYGTTLFMQWRGRLDITQATIATLLVFIVTGKVFSPQYLIWLMPLLVYAGAFDTFWLLLWGAISLLTTFISTYFYTRLVDPTLIPYTPGFIATVTLRNALFVLLTLAYLFNWFDARQRKPLPPPLTGKETRPL